jgi:hypothetical protein
MDKFKAWLTKNAVAIIVLLAASLAFLAFRKGGILRKKYRR